jgi:hypothetical protein
MLQIIFLNTLANIVYLIDKVLVWHHGHMWVNTDLIRTDQSAQAEDWSCEHLQPHKYNFNPNIEKFTKQTTNTPV